MMTLWIARDKDNSLSLFVSKPINHRDECWIPREDIDCGNYLTLPDSEYPEITFENSPQQINLQ